MISRHLQEIYSRYDFVHSNYYGVCQEVINIVGEEDINPDLIDPDSNFPIMELINQSFIEYIDSQRPFKTKHRQAIINYSKRKLKNLHFSRNAEYTNLLYKVSEKSVLNPIQKKEELKPNKLKYWRDFQHYYLNRYVSSINVGNYGMLSREGLGVIEHNLFVIFSGLETLFAKARLLYYLDRGLGEELHSENHYHISPN